MSNSDSRGHALEGLQNSGRAEHEPRPFLEVRSETGVQYIEPSRWERFRLRWAFRHFQVLPLQLLTPRNRRLVLKLMQTSPPAERHRVQKSEVFGVVETTRWQPDEEDTDAALLRSARKEALSREPTLLRKTGLSPTNLSAIGAHSRTRNAPSADLQEASTESQFSRSRLSQSWLVRGLATPGVRILCVSLSGAALLLLAFTLEDHYHDPSLAELSQPQALTIPQSPAQQKTVPPSLAQSRPSENPAPMETAKPADAALPPFPSLLELQHSALATVATKHSQDVSPIKDPAAASVASTPDNTQTVDSALPPAHRITVLPQVRLVYPVVSDARLTGDLKLMAWIGPDGSVTRVSVLGGDPRLAKAGIRAVSQWRYTPAASAHPAQERAAEISIKFFGQDAVSILPVAAGPSPDSRN